MNKYKGNSKLLTYDELQYLLSKYQFELKDNNDIKVNYLFSKSGLRINYLHKDKRDMLNLSRNGEFKRKSFIIDKEVKELYIKGIREYKYDWNLIILQQVITKLLLEDINYLDYEMSELYDIYKTYYYNFLKEKGI